MFQSAMHNIQNRELKINVIDKKIIQRKLISWSKIRPLVRVFEDIVSEEVASLFRLCLYISQLILQFIYNGSSILQTRST